MSAKLPPVAILAGGLGTRLYDVTQKQLPKALAPLNGVPFIDHQLRLLQERGITRAVLCVGHLGEMIEQHVGNGSQYGMNVSYAYDGDVLLGTGGALKNALHLLDDAFFVLYGDSYLLCDYRAIHRAFMVADKPALMTVFKNASQWDTSNVHYSNGQVKRYDKRNATPDMIYIDYGLSLVTKQVFDGVSTTTPTDLSDIYHRLSIRGHLAGFEVTQRFYEIGTPESLRELEVFLKTARGSR